MANFTKDQRNEIHRAISSSRLDPSECTFGDQAKGVGYYVSHNPSRSWFTVDRSEKPPYTFGIRGRLGDDPAWPMFSVNDFKGTVNNVLGWANKVADWIDTPDLWAAPQADVPGQFIPESANTAFTEDEQAAISHQLRAIRETVKKIYELTAEQSAALDEKFEEAEKASRRMGRKDWGLLFGGAVFSLILTDVITPGIAEHILIMVQHGIGYLFTDGSVRGVLSDGQG
jgi:hypothetical protein